MISFSPIPLRSGPPSDAPMEVERSRVLAFLFPSVTDQWLGILRIGLGIQVALYCVSLRTDWNYLFAGTGKGLLSRQLAEAMVSAESSLIPKLGWLVEAGEHLGMGEGATLFLIWIVLLTAACCLIAGLYCRASSFTAWFLHLCATNSGGLVSYGVDNFMTIALFYLTLAPLPDRYSLDRKLWEKPAKDPRVVGFFRRVLQIHLCLIYFFSGLTKCLGLGWWNGSNLWRALIRPPFSIIPPEIIVRWEYLLPLMGILIWVIEIAYPFLIWVKKTRHVCLLLICLMHLAIGFTMGMYLFALIMIVLNVAAFGPAMFPGQVRTILKPES